MNVEFHYYMIFYLAKKVGFTADEANVIAYSSQHTDDNQKIYVIGINENETYSNYISQTMDIFNPMTELMRVYLCFHFLPGNYEKSTVYRKDGKLHLLNTTPNSDNIVKVMNETIKLESLYRLGIALHVLADSWSHQNFIGCNDYMNSDHELIKVIIPNIGHADFLHQPDEVSLIWEDKRLIPSNSQVHNKKRILEASEVCFYWLNKYKNKNSNSNAAKNQWNEIYNELSTAIGEEYFGYDKNKNNRLASYRQMIGKDFIEYDSLSWFNEIIDTKSCIQWKPFPKRLHKYHFKKTYTDSHWFGFQEAIKKHQTFTRSILDEQLAKMEILNF